MPPSPSVSSTTGSHHPLQTQQMLWISSISLEVLGVKFLCPLHSGSLNILYDTIRSVLLKQSQKFLPYLSYVLGQTGLREQYKPRSDATECGICSGSTLFATYPVDFRLINTDGQSLGQVWKWVKVCYVSWAIIIIKWNRWTKTKKC